MINQCHGGALGPLIQEAPLYKDDGSSTTLFFANFQVYISALFNQGGSFTQLVHQAHAAMPSSQDRPWGLILYADEVVPGNVLGRAERKVWTVYCSILQFQDHLSQEDSWLTLCVERSSFISTLDGGIAQIMSIILKSMFNQPIQDPRTSGMRLKNASMGDLTIWLDFTMVLADGAAQKQIWSSKGDSGTRFCLLCCNVHGRPTAQAQEDDPEELHCDTMRYEQLHLVQDQEILDSYQRLHGRARSCTKSDFAKWQKACGLSYSQYAIMLCPELLNQHLLRPISQFCHDWMHGILQGTGPVVLHYTLATISEQNFQVYSFLEEYIQCWTAPRSWKGSQLHLLFSKKQMEKAKKETKFPCIASECLALFPLVRHFLETSIEPHGLCPQAVKACLAMANVIDQCHGGVQWRTTTRRSLLAAVENANKSFHEAWPAATMIRKWHWHLHLPDTLQRFGLLPSCFTAERKHKTISAYATRLQKTHRFEYNLLHQILSNEISTLKELDLFPEAAHMMKPKRANTKQLAALAPFLSQPCPGAETSSVAKLSRGGQIFAGDVIIFSDGGGLSNWKVGQVVFHAKVFGLKTSLVQLWAVEAQHQHYATCKLGHATGIIPMENILFAVPFHQEEDVGTILLPYQIYSQHM